MKKNILFAFCLSAFLPFCLFSQKAGYALLNPDGTLGDPPHESLDRWWWNGNRTATANVTHDARFKTSTVNNVGAWHMNFGDGPDATMTNDSVLFSMTNYQVMMKASDRIILRGASGLNPNIILDKSNERIEIDEAGGDIRITTLTRDDAATDVVGYNEATGQIYKTALRPCNIYTALITQSGTSAPTATVLDNTLSGAIVWTRIDVGDYTGTLSGAFTASATWLIPAVAALDGNGSGWYLTRTSSNTVKLYSFDANNLSDGVLNESPIEIRVY